MNTSLAPLLEKITTLAIKYKREPQQIQLLAVSKMQSLEKMTALYQQGQLAFGENYLQEAMEKIVALSHLAIEWHYIGQIQANKTRAIAEHFAWVQTVAAEKIARRLHEQRPAHLPALNVLIQVNLDQEPQKGGIAAEAVRSLAECIQHYPKLKLRGLMAIPAEHPDFEQQCASFRRLKHLFTDLNQHGFELDVLSMGMSHDMEAAIAEGSTLVRIGTALFGERPKKNTPPEALNSGSAG